MAASKGKASVSLLEQYKANQIAEWDVFVCGPIPIDIGSARAFNPGDAVPASHVTRGVVREDQVVARDDADGMDSLAEIPSSPAATGANLRGANDQPDADTQAVVTKLYGTPQSNNGELG